MSGVLERTLGVLGCLLVHPEGLPVSMIAAELGIPASAAHRLLSDLVKHGYVRQIRDQGDYVLTTKLVAMVLDYMGATGIVDFAQPVLDRLAQSTGEFVRLAVIDGERLTWVARAQGARRGLRYDPDVEATARLSCTASGHAWLMTLPDERALSFVARQGFGEPGAFGPHAPTTPKRLLQCLAEARARGFGMTVDMFAPGLSSVAVPIYRGSETLVGVLSLAGPTVRLTVARMRAFVPVLQSAADEIARTSATSPLFASRRRSDDAPRTERAHGGRKPAHARKAEAV